MAKASKVSGNQCFTSISLPKKPRLHSCLAQYKKKKLKENFKSQEGGNRGRKHKPKQEPQSLKSGLRCGEDAQYFVSSLRLLPSALISLPHFFFPAILPPHFLPQTPQLHGNHETLYPNPLQRGPTSPPLDPKQFSFTADGLKKKKSKNNKKKSHFFIC